MLYDENQKYLDKEIQLPVNETEIRRHLDTHFKRTWHSDGDTITLFIVSFILLVGSVVCLLIVVDSAFDFATSLRAAPDAPTIIFNLGVLLVLFVIMGGAGLYAGFLSILFMVSMLRSRLRYKSFVENAQRGTGTVIYVLNANDEQQIHYQYLNMVTMEEMQAAFITSTAKDIDADDELTVLHDRKICVLV